MKLYVNLFKEQDDTLISSLIRKSKGCNFLNFQGNQIEIEGVNNVVIEEFRNYSECYNKAVSSYTSFVAELSEITIGDRHIRSYKYKDFPLFWLTGISEKHYHHWMMKFMLLRELMIENKDFFGHQKEATFFLPGHIIGVEHLIEELFKSFNIPVHFQYANKFQEKKANYALFKIAIRTLMLFLKMKAPHLSSEPFRIAFLLRGSITDYTKQFFENIIQISELKKEDVALIPLYYWIDSKFKLAYNIPKLFWDIRPGTLFLIDAYYKQYKVLKLLNKIKVDKRINVAGISISSRVIVNELKNALIDENKRTVMYDWLNRYQNKADKEVKFFYEDEFYPGGRAISAGLQGSKTYSVQHSMISNNHTVYHISDIESNSTEHSKNDGLPLPNCFVVWGDYFKKQFLAHNSFSENFVYVAGNPTYTKKYLGINRVNKGDDFTVLYCLTTAEIFSREKNIIKNLLDNIPNLKLRIRFHPSWKFEKKIVMDFFENIEVDFSEESDIFDSINRSNVVVSSAHSGVWLDALVGRKPVIRLITLHHDDISEGSQVFNVANHDEFQFAIDQILGNELTSGKNEFIYLEADKWKRLICN